MRSFFGGMRGGGGNNNRGKASAAFMQSLNKGAGTKEPTADEKYKQMFEDRLAASKKEAGASKHYTFALPGTKSEGRKMSKSAEQLLEQLAAKKVQQEIKKAKKLEARRVAETKRHQKIEMLKKQKEAAAKAAAGQNGISSLYNPGAGQASHTGTVWGSTPNANNTTGGFWGGGSDKKDDGWW